MDSLIRKRSSIKGRVTKLQNKVNDKYLDIDEALANVMIASAQEYMNELKTTADSILVLCTDDDDMVEHENYYDEVLSNLHALIAKLVNISNLSKSTQKSFHSVIQLPTIKLPTFNGEVDQWTSFRDMFESLVNNNNSLSNIQKFQYLKTSLTQDAAELIQHLQLNAENYAIAWDLLCKNYSNIYGTVNYHLKNIMEVEYSSSKSMYSFKNIINTLRSNLNALNSLGVNTDNWDILLIYVIENKFDDNTYLEWVKRIDKRNLPSLNCLYEFLEEMAIINERTEGRMTIRKKTEVSSYNNNTYCQVCKKGNHKLYECSIFKNYTIKDRITFVTKNNLCHNCLSSKTHFAVKCMSKSVCKICSKKHHSLLHQFTSQVNYAADNQQEEEDIMSSEVVGEASICNEENNLECEVDIATSSHQTTACTQYQTNVRHQVLLSTALVSVEDKDGIEKPVRVLLDSGSQSNFITTECVKRLNLSTSKVDPINVNGIGGLIQFKVDSVVNLTLKSRHESFVLPLTAIIVPKVTNKLPAVSFGISNWSYLKNVKLSDPEFNITSKIDMIVGSEYFFSILKAESSKAPHGYPSLQNSKFGWIITGKVPETNSSTVTNLHVNLEGSIKKFWELEELPIVKHLSQEEKDCELHFMETTTREPNGRFMVKLPFKKNIEELGESKLRALARVKTVEKGLNLDEFKKRQYFEFMKEYLDLGHMSKVSDVINMNETLPHYYLPHHSVIREASTTTRLRVVFDGSAKTSSGNSINDMLMVGPTLQDTIFSLLIRFRSYRVVLKADCEKMYRQILIHPDDRKFQKIIWYDDDNNSLSEYELNTLTYGTSCAPYIAVKCLMKLADDEKKKFPKAAEVTKRDFFMDDLVSGTDTIEEAVELYHDLNNMFQSAGFNLRKWSSNEQKVLSEIPEQNRDTKINVQFENDANCSIKALGLSWNMKEDILYYNIQLDEHQSTCTKRSILSEISRYYDPLGLLSPVIISAKIKIQKLWLANLNWDDLICGEFATDWTRYRSKLRLLNEIRPSRNVVPFSSSDINIIELHGFSDASEAAYAACVYVRVVSVKKEVSTNLLCAKTRVSPLKQVSLPRLELCAAVLLAKLMNQIHQSWRGKINSYVAWTDSMIVLDWLRQEPRKWKTFVANRVSQIHELFDPNIWHYVPSEENPADVASRGISAENLNENSLWWHGPGWMKSFDLADIMKNGKPQLSDENLVDKRKVKTMALLVQNDKFSKIEIWNQVSSFIKMVRVMAWCLRFVKNSSKNVVEKTNSEYLDVSEIQKAKHLLVKLVQQESFDEDIRCIKEAGSVNCKSSIKNLDPFLDSNGILRVGGRLSNSELVNEAKHQILLPKNHNFSKRLVEFLHEKYVHAGPNLLLAHIRQEYWIVNGLNLAKKVFHNCLACLRSNTHRLKPNQKMGDLPERRVKFSPPFATCGVDYAGPFMVRRMGGRSNVLFKAYVALFVCFSTKAYHIEIVSDLSTKAFFDALRRFVSRRGKPSNIYSDNGTNFVGCDNMMKQFIKDLQKSEEFNVYFANEEITWHFIPPNSPHMGGLWESGVKNVKSNLKRVIGEQSLSFEQLSTTLSLIEATLNSRPLTPISNDANDLECLTPGHFLIGRPLTSVPEPIIPSIPSNRLQKWALSRKIQQDFWKRWSLEYLNTLTQKFKWHFPVKNIQTGDMVLIRDENLPPGKWKLGRVNEIFLGSDNLVRVVSIFTKSGLVKRAISRIIKLPMND